jgi:hypothetical protein
MCVIWMNVNIIPILKRETDRILRNNLSPDKENIHAEKSSR